MNATVTIISIWSKIEGLEGRLAGRTENFQYDVEVPIFVGEDTHEDLLEKAFELTNRDDRPHGNRCCSTTAGDIMVIEGNHYLVEMSGFHKLYLRESEAIQKLTSRDTSFGYKWLTSKNLIS